MDIGVILVSLAISLPVLCLYGLYCRVRGGL